MQRFVERYGECVLIRWRADRSTASLLRCHVPRRSRDFAPGGVGQRPRQSKVRDASPSVATDQDVSGLEVAVDDPSLVRGMQTACCVGEHGQDLRLGPRRPDPRRQRLPVDVLHGNERPTVDLPNIEHRDDIGVREPSGVASLLEQRRFPFARGALPRQYDLERELAIELGVVGHVDLAHATAPRERHDHVAAEEVPFGQTEAGRSRALTSGSTGRRNAGGR